MRCYKHLQDEQAGHADKDCQQDVFGAPGDEYGENSRDEPGVAQ